MTCLQAGDVKPPYQDLYSMHRAYWLLAILFLIPISLVASDETEAYFSSLKNLNFEEAKTAAISGDSPLHLHMNILVEVLSYQQETPSEIAFTGTESNLLKVIKFLIVGYQELYSNNQTSIEAYINFSSALNLSEQDNSDYLIKASLIALLDLLKHEIFIGSKQYNPYLDRFRELKSDRTDEVLLILYEIVFYSKGDEHQNIDYNYYEAISALDAVFNTLPKNHLFFSFYYHEKGIQYKLAKEYDLSEWYFKKVDSIAREKSFLKKLHGTNLWQLADLMQLAGNMNGAKEYLKKSRNTAEDLRDVFYDDLLSSRIFARSSSYDSAYYFLKKSVDMEYTLGAKNNTLESSILAVQNQTDKLKLDKLRLDAKNKANQNLLIAAMSLLIFGGVIAVLFYKNTSKKRRLAEQQEEIQKQKVEALLKEQELMSIDAMIEGQEKERQRVANELHDDLGSLMATVKLHFENIKVNEKDTSLGKASTLLEQAYQKIRGIAHSKNSGVMATQGLLPAVRKMARTITETDQLVLEVHDYGLEDRMENSLELSIFRIIQELVANIIKHAKASKGSIQFTQHEESLNILIEDNGIGFDTSKINASVKGMGLHSIEKRIEYAEGDFTIDSILGKGTSIIINIPI